MQSGRALPLTRAVVFDLDGTLVDSLGDIGTHLNAALADHGLETRSAGEVVEWIGHGADHLVACAVPDPALASLVLASFRAHYRARPVIETRLYAGLDRALDTIGEGRALGVLSNKPHDLTVTITEHLVRRWPFRVVHGQHPDRPRKPDPEALHSIACELEIDVADCVLVGDSEIDIQTARAAGATSIGVTWGLRPRHLVVAAAPDYLVDTPAELAALFTS